MRVKTTIAALLLASATMQSLHARPIDCGWEELHQPTQSQPRTPISRATEKHTMHTPTNYAETHLDQIIAESLFPVIQARCVSSEKTPQEMLPCAQLVGKIMHQNGITTTKILQTGNSYPAVYGEIRSPNLNAPTILIQGHYDGQPSEEEKWEIAKPHKPRVHNGRVYGRGTSDDWGQVLAQLIAVQSYIASKTPLPVNVKFLIEGGEEKGSKDMDKLLFQYKDLLACNAVVINDSAPGRRGHKVITPTTRGLAAATVGLTLGTNNPHSGDNIAQNAVALLSTILTSLKDYKTQRVLIPHFYDSVVVPTAEERARLNAIPFDTELFRSSYSLDTIITEEGFTPQETMWIRPSYEIHNIEGGVKGNNIPTQANARVTMRIVPRQEPEQIFTLFENAFYARSAEYGIKKERISVKRDSMSYPFSTPTTHPYFRIMESALEEAFGATVDYMGVGGSEPIAVHHQQILKVPVIFIGTNGPDDSYHGHDESLSLDDFIKSINAAMKFYEKLAVVGSH